MILEISMRYYWCLEDKGNMIDVGILRLFRDLGHLQGPEDLRNPAILRDWLEHSNSWSQKNGSSILQWFYQRTWNIAILFNSILSSNQVPSKYSRDLNLFFNSDWKKKLVRWRWLPHWKFWKYVLAFKHCATIFH